MTLVTNPQDEKETMPPAGDVEHVYVPDLAQTDLPLEEPRATRRERVRTKSAGERAVDAVVIGLLVALIGLVSAMFPYFASALRDTNDRIDDTNVRIDDTNVRIDETNDRLAETNVRIDETNDRLAETNDRLAELGVRIAEQGVEMREEIRRSEARQIARIDELAEQLLN